MMRVKITAGDQVAFIENDEQVLGDVKIHAEQSSQNLLTFLEFEIYGKRGLRHGCGCNDHSHAVQHSHEESCQLDSANGYLVTTPDNMKVIDTSSDEYIVNVLINEICLMYGLTAEIIEGEI